MGDDDHRHAVGGQLAHDLQHLVDHLGVERRGGLVEEHDLGVHRQRPGDRDPLLLAAGQLGGVLRRLGADADPLQQFLGGPHGPVLGDAADLHLAEDHVLQHGLVGEQVEALEDHADLGPQPGQFPALGGQRAAVDGDRPGVDGLQPVDRPAQRGLSGAGGADQYDHLALLDLQIDVLEDVQRTEVLVDVAQDHQGSGVGAGVLVEARAHRACSLGSARGCELPWAAMVVGIRGPQPAEPRPSVGRP